MLDNVWDSSLRVLFCLVIGNIRGCHVSMPYEKASPEASVLMPKLRVRIAHAHLHLGRTPYIHMHTDIYIYMYVCVSASRLVDVLHEATYVLPNLRMRAPHDRFIVMSAHRGGDCHVNESCRKISKR